MIEYFLIKAAYPQLISVFLALVTLIISANICSMISAGIEKHPWRADREKNTRKVWQARLFFVLSLVSITVGGFTATTIYLAYGGVLLVKFVIWLFFTVGKAE